VIAAGRRRERPSVSAQAVRLFSRHGHPPSVSHWEGPADGVPAPDEEDHLKDTLRDLAWPDDFWIASTPEAEGLDPDGLEAAVRAIDERGLPIHAFLAVRHGKLILERYGMDGGRQLGPGDLRELFSTAKTVTAALVGLAIREGRLPGLSARALTYFPGGEIEDRSAAKEWITLEDLLTMRSGLAFQEGNEHQRFFEPPSAAARFLSRPMVAEPGTRWNYSGGDSQILAEILRRATGVDPGEWARRRIFEPLGIRDLRWQADAGGTTFGGFGLWMRPRDLARFGWMLLRGGRWKDREVVPGEWVASFTRGRVPTSSPAGTYAYHCWAPRIGGFATRGYMGQSMYAFANRDLLVLFNAALQPDQAEIILDELVRGFVLPAVR
jgi:CubicO group peptidase (beta-lactamase class C family)